MHPLKSTLSAVCSSNTALMKSWKRLLSLDKRRSVVINRVFIIHCIYPWTHSCIIFSHDVKRLSFRCQTLRFSHPNVKFYFSTLRNLSPGSFRLIVGRETLPSRCDHCASTLYVPPHQLCTVCMNIDGMGSAPPPGVKKGSCWEDWREEGIDLRWTGILTIILITPSAVDTSWAWHCFATKPNCHFPPAKASDRNKKYFQHCTLWCLFCFVFVLLFSLFHNFFFFLLHYITLRRRSLITYCKLHTFVTYCLTLLYTHIIYHTTALLH